MATFTRSDDLRGAEFVDVDLRGARFIEADLSGVVMRGVQVAGADIDAPWLPDGESFLRVSGRRVVVRPDVAAPGLGHGHVARPRDP
jgi:Pentapeptide repeats (8 copies)